MVSNQPAAGSRLFPFLLILSGLIIYSNSFSVPFLFDDLPNIVYNAFIQHSWLTQNALEKIWIYGVGSWRPLVAFSLWINYALGGLQVWGYHAFNICIHILSGLLLFGIVRRTLLMDRLRERFSQDAVWLAGGIALIWLVHPLHTTSVTYIIQRAESMMGLFYLLTLYGVIRGVNDGRGWYFLAILSCALGMASKQVMVTAPIVTFLYDRIFLSKSFQELWQKRGGLYAGLVSTWLLLGFFSLSAMPRWSAGFNIHELTPWDYARSQCGVILHYLKLSFWPHPLVFDYLGWPIARSFGDFGLQAACIAILLSLTIGSLFWFPALGFLGAWFFLILSPTSSIFPLLDIVAEHRMYLPLAAIVTLTVMVTDSLMKYFANRFSISKPVRAGFAATLVLSLTVVLGTLTFQRNQDYRTPLSIWQDTISKRPDNLRAHFVLGKTYLDAGDTDKALALFSTMVHLAPDSVFMHDGMAQVSAKMGHFEEAASHFSEAIRFNQDHYYGYQEGLGRALAKQGKLNEALPHFRKALELEPGDLKSHYNLGVTLAKLGKWQEAREHLPPKGDFNTQPEWWD